MDDRHLLAHELRAPLTSIELELSALLERDPDNDRLKRCLQEVSMLQSLVTNFLDLETEVEDSSFPLAPLIERIGLRFQPIAEAKGVKLVAECPDASAGGDSRATERILSNLVDNAIKFSSDEGSVHVRASRRNGVIEIEVRDEGVGIAGELHERIFEPFYRIDKESPGSGLGLALARRLAEAQGGTLDVESRQQEGASFTLKLRAT